MTQEIKKGMYAGEGEAPKIAPRMVPTPPISRLTTKSPEGLKAPGEWIKDQKERLAEQTRVQLAQGPGATTPAAGVSEEPKLSDRHKLVEAFEPIYRYLETVSKAGIKLESHSSRGYDHSMLLDPWRLENRKDITNYWVTFERWETHPDRKWRFGFGVRAVGTGNGIVFETYDFGTFNNFDKSYKGRMRTTVPTAEEAIEVFMNNVAYHLSSIGHQEVDLDVGG